MFVCFSASFYLQGHFLYLTNSVHRGHPVVSTPQILFWDYYAAKIYGSTLQSLCLLVSAVCYSKIFITLRRHEAEVQENVHRTQSNKSASLNLKRYSKTVSAAVWS